MSFRVYYSDFRFYLIYAGCIYGFLFFHVIFIFKKIFIKYGFLFSYVTASTMSVHIKINFLRNLIRDRISQHSSSNNKMLLPFLIFQARSEYAADVLLNNLSISTQILIKRAHSQKLFIRSTQKKQFILHFRSFTRFAVHFFSNEPRNRRIWS